MRWWAFWRRVLYGTFFLSLCALMSYGLYLMYGYTPPSCLDGRQNGDELGIDCDGRCARVCSASLEPSVRWANAFRATQGMYNAVAYVENRNVGIGVAQLQYTVSLYDAQGIIAERNGVIELPPNSVVPIFESRMQTGDRTPTKTIVSLDSAPVWVRASQGQESIFVRGRSLINADTAPILNATLENTSLEELSDLDVVATIFDRRGTPLTASRTRIPLFPPRSERAVTFTWQEPIAKTLRSCEVPSDIVLAIDLSGSMNNDAGDPPEPITSVLRAASMFTDRLGTQDQVSLVTYATRAEVVASLTSDHERVRQSITELGIDPLEEQGSTNTGDAVNRAREVLSSDRHNTNARKVLILLTDGRATGPDTADPEAYAREAAETLKEDGVIVYAIGLGQLVNESFLKELASSELHYFNAPTAATLNDIYTTITSALCEEGASVIEIIPKRSGMFESIVP